MNLNIYPGKKSPEEQALTWNGVEFFSYVDWNDDKSVDDFLNAQRAAKRPIGRVEEALRWCNLNCEFRFATKDCHESKDRFNPSIWINSATFYFESTTDAGRFKSAHGSFVK